ncbi:protein ATP6V1FNB [Girardinichthys multiradiatus]|uniref:protein ATP6V1FNB n=1 Tax=Girardinichthys multiradiatus TaxID=208333 RepID=UPI001FAD19C4|nr:protein ATP6V1FNB [Girardinichthys multiradiatus]
MLNSKVLQEMRNLLTTQSQNFYKEQVQKQVLTRLAWKSRYAKLYPSSYNSLEPTKLPQLSKDTQAITAAVPRAPGKQIDLPRPPPLPKEGKQHLDVPPLMRPTSPQTRQALYQDSSHNGRGRSLYLRKRSYIRPEEKFDFPLLSSWEYGWRLGDYTVDYRTPSCARSSVVKSTFYARNGVFNNPSATDVTS